MNVGAGGGAAAAPAAGGAAAAAGGAAAEEAPKEEEKEEGQSIFPRQMYGVWECLLTVTQRRRSRTRIWALVCSIKRLQIQLVGRSAGTGICIAISHT